jgi:hypothetical protein
MAWTSSEPFMAFIEDALENTTAFNLATDDIKVALFDNSITPSQTVASASSAYAAGVWASGGVLDASGWPAIGRQLLSLASGFSSNVYTLDAADTASANSTTTLAANYGALIYDDTLAAPVANQGICYVYFGGANAVTNGNYVVQWAAGGIMTFTG